MSAARPKRRGWQVITIGAALACAGPAFAQSPAAERGFTFVRVHCASCHSIDKVTESPLSIAVPFRTLRADYPFETLIRALAEGRTTGHPSMPEFRLDPGQINDVLAYLETLRR